MTKLNQFKQHLKRGNVYRRADLARWSSSIDRHLALLLKDGTLQKLSQGLYYYPKETAFGATPPDEASLVRSFLKDDHFLLTSPNDYNSLGVGTTQLYNKRVVYNHKRHGEFNLGGRNFTFCAKHRFPKTVTEEFLLVDLVNNLDTLSEDKTELLKNVYTKAQTMDRLKLKRTLSSYGNAKTKTLFNPLVNTLVPYAH